MRFLIRLALLSGVALYFLPAGLFNSAEHRATSEPEVGALEAVSAAQRAVKDFANICERDPAVCDTGRAVLRSVGAKARDAAFGAYQTLDQALDDDKKTPPADVGPAPAKAEPPVPAKAEPPVPAQRPRHPVQGAGEAHP